MESHGILTFLLKRSKPKKSLARTSSSKTKQCAPPKAGLPSEPRIHWRKRAKQRGGGVSTPPPPLFFKQIFFFFCVLGEKGRNGVGVASQRPLLIFFKTI